MSRRAGLADELQRRDWAAFAGEYEGGPGAAAYANALAAAFAALPPTSDDGYRRLARRRTTRR